MLLPVRAERLVGAADIPTDFDLAAGFFGCGTAFAPALVVVRAEVMAAVVVETVVVDGTAALSGFVREFSRVSVESAKAFRFPPTTTLRVARVAVSGREEAAVSMCDRERVGYRRGRGSAIS